MTRYPSKDLLALLAGMVKDPTVISNVAISHISMDSREVQLGGLFIATAKNQQQRINHIEQAITGGVSVVLLEQVMVAEVRIDSVQVIVIKALETKVSEIAARFFGHPSLAQTIIAVTGTNGKTSVTQFIAQCIELSGQACGVIGTLGTGRIDALTDTGMTTPDPVKIQATLAAFFHQSINTVVIEASSHALDQSRLNSVAIDVAVLTNLSRDHLDYHHDMASYAAAKKRLFQFDSVKTAVINAQDALGQELIQALASNKAIDIITYGRDVKASLAANDAVMTQKGFNFSLVKGNKSAQIESTLIGLFNVENLLATAGSLLAIGMSFEQVMAGIQQCRSAIGRMEVYDGKNKATVVIDFAHTPDALTKALQSLQLHKPKQAELWCVLGCGGDRDRGKRPLMGAAAEQNADQIVITSDNPRSEENSVIVEEILMGLKNHNHHYIEHDRQQAIQYAIRHAKHHDIILVAGKGHENYQEIAGVKVPYSDIDTVTTAMNAANDAQNTLVSVT
ncbi:MAG: UDP-N-acetylmuramoyl-L-alanyl-D-glutamate--2,6-diaminopimelate ligase [Methylophagaceae bacterium]|jgi:UDP-N-acetylmuramoyl-L-alanyl-D-glutamate--2,6-diaminopimelate ligase